MRKTTKVCATGVLALMLGGMVQLPAMAADAPAPDSAHNHTAGTAPAPATHNAGTGHEGDHANHAATPTPAETKPAEKAEENDYGHTGNVDKKMRETREKLDNYKNALTDKVPAGYEEWAKSKDVQDARAKAKKEYSDALSPEKLSRDDMKLVVAYNEGKVKYLPKKLWKYSEKAQKEKPAEAPAKPAPAKKAEKQKTPAAPVTAAKKAGAKKAVKTDVKKADGKKTVVKKVVVKKTVKAGVADKAAKATEKGASAATVTAKSNTALAHTGTTAGVVGGVSLALLLAGGGVCLATRKRA